jgi:hypothetical protein
LRCRNRNGSEVAMAYRDYLLRTIRYQQDFSFCKDNIESLLSAQDV